MRCLSAPVAIFVSFYLTVTIVSSVEGLKTHRVEPGKSIDVQNELGLNIFCRDGDKKSLTNYFRSATLRIISTADDIKLIKGHSITDVYDQFSHSTKWFLWAANLLPWRVRETSFPTFNSSCVGISTSKPYLAMLIIRPIDGWNLCTLIAGIGLFFLAPKLSKSTLFFYGSGTMVGALGAAVVLLFVVTRVLPKGKGYYLTITALWTLCLYYTGEIWKSIQQLLYEKLPYIMVYLTSGAAIALILCYRLGPPQNPRTLDLIRWALQVGGVCLIHLSSDLVEVSTSIIVLTILYYNFSKRILYFTQKHWRRRFPPKTKFISEEEYISQGALETNKELEKLREYCSSPECNSWKLVTRLKDPRRFSGFIEGSSHLSDDEMMDYETEIIHTDQDDDDDIDEVEDELLTDDDDDEVPVSVSYAQSPVRRSQRMTNGKSAMMLTDDENDLTD